MGKEKYLKDVKRLFEKSPVVRFSSILRIVRTKKKVKQYSKKLIRNLILKEGIRKLTKGYYTIYDDPSLLVYCFDPSYLGLQDAMSYHNIWEQEAIPIIITPRKVRQGVRKVLGMNVLIRRISKKYFFGFDYCKHKNFYLPYSDIEKTFVDMVYFKEKLSADVIKSIKKRIDKKKLNSYLKNYPEKVKRKVLRYL